MDIVKRRTPIFERFDIISIVMPFYGSTHKAFWVLSSLWTSSRNKLDEFYIEFINIMRKYWNIISVKPYTKIECLFLPNDLFEYTNWNITYDNIHKFVEFISNISNSIGWHFNGHFMHSQLKFRGWIELQSSEVVQLQPHFEALQSISVLATDERDASTLSRQLCSAGQSRSSASAEWGPTKRECIANIISISSKSNYRDVLIPHFYDEDIDRPNLLFDNFKSISYIQFASDFTYEKCLKFVSLINKAWLKIMNLEIDSYLF